MGANAALLLTGAQTLGTYTSQRQQAGAVLASGAYHQRLANWNADRAERDAALVEQRGQRDANLQRVATRQTIGSQRAAFAAQGVEVNDGSALEVQADTAMLGELDALMIQSNAAREALGYKAQAATYRQQGIYTGMAARSEASRLKTASFNTLLTGATDMYRIYDDKKRGG